MSETNVTFYPPIEVQILNNLVQINQTLKLILEKFDKVDE